MDIKGTRFWIVGASSGIGAELATQLTDLGGWVAISARREDELNRIANGRMRVVPADVTDLDSMIAAADNVREEFGAIDVAIFNAGYWAPVKIDEFSSAPFQKSFDTNVMGLVHGIEAVLPQMIEAGGGTIAAVASVAGFRGLPNSSAYGATKAAEINLLESLRGDLAARGVKVQTICPGFVDTPMTSVNKFPMPFMITAEKAAASIVRGLRKEKIENVFPLQVMLMMKLARLVPVRPWAAALTSMAKKTRAKGLASAQSGATARTTEQTTSTLS